MRVDNASKIGPAEDLSLHLGGVFEHVVNECDGGNAGILNCDGVKHGRRGTGPSGPYANDCDVSALRNFRDDLPRRRRESVFFD